MVPRHRAVQQLPFTHQLMWPSANETLGIGSPVLPTRTDLTSHSSRCRFAARLNSGVRHQHRSQGDPVKEKFLRTAASLSSVFAIALATGCSPSFTGKEAVLDQLKDPASAEFRNVNVSTFSGSPLVCGEVNAKNSHGGYTGFRHFMIKEDRVYLASDELSSVRIDGCCYVSSAQGTMGDTQDWRTRHRSACSAI